MLMLPTFETFNAALSLGFLPAGPLQYRVYRECSIHGFANGIGSARGYSYSLRVEIPETFTSNYLGVYSNRLFGLSTEVLILDDGPIQEVSSQLVEAPSGLVRDIQISRRGQVALMFESTSFKEAMEEAMDWTDKWFCAHPQATAKAHQALFHRREAGHARA